MQDSNFDALTPIEALLCFRMFKTQCDKTTMSEGAVIPRLPNFLFGDAKQIYQSELELVDEGVGGITSYCHAVQFIRTKPTIISTERSRSLRTFVRRMMKMRRHMRVDCEAKPSALVVSILRPPS